MNKKFLSLVILNIVLYNIASAAKVAYFDRDKLFTNYKEVKKSQEYLQKKENEFREEIGAKLEVIEAKKAEREKLEAAKKDTTKADEEIKKLYEAAEKLNAMRTQELEIIYRNNMEQLELNMAKAAKKLGEVKKAEFVLDGGIILFSKGSDETNTLLKILANETVKEEATQLANSDKNAIAYINITDIINKYSGAISMKNYIDSKAKEIQMEVINASKDLSAEERDLKMQEANRKIYEIQAERQNKLMSELITAIHTVNMTAKSQLIIDSRRIYYGGQDITAQIIKQLEEANGNTDKAANNVITKEKGFNIGFVDVDKVMHSKKFEQSAKSIEAKKAAIDKELDEKVTKIQKIEDITKTRELTEAEKTNLNNLKEEFYEFQNKKGNEFYELRKKFLDRINGNLKMACQVEANNKGLDLVIKKDSSVFYCENDITDSVIKVLSTKE